MQCANCQAEIPTWHAYCPECCSPVPQCENADEKQTAAQTNSNHARRSLLPVLLGFFASGALIVMAREVKLNELPKPAPADKTAKVIAVTDSDSKSAKPTPTRRRGNPANPKAGENNPQPTPAPTISEVSQPGVQPKASAPSEIIADTAAGPALEVEPAEEQVSRNIGLLTIKSYMRARLYVDGQFSGYTPRTIKLVPGEHKIALLADGHEEWSRSVRLKGGQQTGIMAALEKKAAP